MMRQNDIFSWFVMALLAIVTHHQHQCQAFILNSQRNTMNDCNKVKLLQYQQGTTFVISSLSLSLSFSCSSTSALHGQNGNNDDMDNENDNTMDVSIDNSNNCDDENTALATTQKINTAITLQRQAEALRSEALMIEKALNETKAEKLRKETEKIEYWIQHLLLVDTNNNNNKDKDGGDDDGGSSAPQVEILNTKDRVAQLLQEERFSAEQINKIFYRICETSAPHQSIDNHSPLIELLLEAACKVDCLEREENPNKRWNHRVERDLRKKLFAMGWNIHLEDEDNGFERFN